MCGDAFPESPFRLQGASIGALGLWKPTTSPPLNVKLQLVEPHDEAAHRHDPPTSIFPDRTLAAENPAFHLWLVVTEGRPAGRGWWVARNDQPTFQAVDRWDSSSGRNTRSPRKAIEPGTGFVSSICRPGPNHPAGLAATATLFKR